MNVDAKPTNTATLTTPGGARLTYEHVGEGPPVLLVHSSPGTAGDWRRVIPELGSGYRVVAPNLPGLHQLKMPNLGNVGTSTSAETDRQPIPEEEPI